MKVKANKKDIVAALSKAVSFIPNSSEGRVSLVYLQANQDGLRVAVSFPDITFITSCPARVQETGDPIALYGRKFYEILRQTSHQVDLFMQDSKLALVSEDSKWVERTVVGAMKTLTPPEDVLARVESEDLHQALKSIKYATSKDTIQPRLHIVDVLDGKVRASNGTNYHEVRLGTKGLTFQIGTPNLDAFTKITKAWTGPISFSADESHFYFTHGSDSLAVARVSTTFPDLDRLVIRPLKAQATYVLKIRKSEAEDALRKVRLSQAADFPYVEMHLSSGECLFRCLSDDGSEAVSKIEANWGGNPRIATFNTSRLYDCILNADKDVLEIKFAKDTRDRKSPLTLENESGWALVNQLKMNAKR